MKEASTDTTYCINEECKNKCWRHRSNFEFKDDKFYWFQSICIEQEKYIK